MKIPGLKHYQFDPEVVCAYYFSAAAHASVKQKRNYTGEPYIVHPTGVLEILMQACPDKVTNAVAKAALLHDTTEDTGVTPELILQLFGQQVFRFVKCLSKATTSSFGNRAERQAVEVKRMSTALQDVQNIKAADLIHNRRSIALHDPGFLQVFDYEAHQLMTVMELVDPRLVALWDTETAFARAVTSKPEPHN